MDVIVKPPWPSQPPRGAGLLKREGNVVRRAMVVDGELLLAEAAWAGEAVHLRGDERAIERLRFVLALDDDLAPFHRAHRSDPLLGRALRGKPRLRVTRTPDPFEALAWAVMYQLIDTQKAGMIAFEFTRRHGTRHPSGAYAAPGPKAFTNQAALQEAGLGVQQARTLARVARDVVNHGFDRRRLEATPGIGPWTLGQMDLFGFGRYDVPLEGDVGIRNSYARMVGVRTGSVTEAEFKAVLDRYAPWQGMAALYITSVGWRGGGRY
jgi:3-methyladenine DNA glycosylase/8-oxoguanine DNA glycosylase